MVAESENAAAGVNQSNRINKASRSGVSFLHDRIVSDTQPPSPGQQEWRKTAMTKLSKNPEFVRAARVRYVGEQLTSKLLQSAMPAISHYMCSSLHGRRAECVDERKLVVLQDGS